MRDTSSTFDDTSTSDDSASEDNANNTENTDSQGGISAYYDKTELPRKKGTGFGRFKPDMPIGTFVIQEKQNAQKDIGYLVDVENWSSGMYFLHIQDQEGKGYVEKVVVE